MDPGVLFLVLMWFAGFLYSQALVRVFRDNRIKNWSTRKKAWVWSKCLCWPLVLGWWALCSPFLLFWDKRYF